MQTEDFLREITGIRGLSGDEGLVSAWTAEKFRPYCDEVSIDVMNNVIARMKGEGPRVVFCAHLDEIGLMVVKIEDDGSLRLGNVGGVDPRILPGQRVTVFAEEPLFGVIGAKPPHLLSEEDRKKNYKREELFADVGLPAERVRELVQIGDQVQLEHRFLKLQNNRAAVKTCDDRACVAVLYRAMELLSQMKHEADVYFVASAQEEVGSRGALTAAYALEPDFAVALDVCHAHTPGAPTYSTQDLDALSSSVGPFLHPVLRQKMLDTAKSQNITLQTDVVPRSTCTDADQIGESRGGVPTALLEVPVKYMHTTVELVDLDTIGEAGRLLAHFAAAVKAGWEDELWT
jgi:endoglucanase